MAGLGNPPEKSEIPSGNRPERRVTDAMLVQFEQSALRSILPEGISENDIETIDLDSVKPPGQEEDAHRHVKAPPTLTVEQSRERIGIVKFKQSLEEFDVTMRLTRLGMSDVKRGDVIEIRTIVGSLYFRIFDRIRGERPEAGEILCECRYDLMDQWSLAHAASIILPVCTKQHVIISPDGSRRFASRALKIRTDQVLPERVNSLMHESFFTEIVHYSNPAPEKFRLVDVLRWLLRCARKIKAFIDENNRLEKEKKLKRQEENRLKQEEQRRIKEERRKARKGKAG